MASGPLTVQLEIKADGSTAIAGIAKVQGALDATGKAAKTAAGGLEQTQGALNQTGSAAQKAAAATQALLDKYDVTGAKARELAKDSVLLNRVLADGGPSAERAKLALANLNQAQLQLTTTGKAAQGGIAALSSSLSGLALTAGAALSVGALASAFITANIESQRLQKGLTAVAGSATAGAAEMEYISKTADKLGLSLTATGSAYVSLTAATKGTALEGDKTRQIFESVSLSMGKLGKSSADTEGALNAIQQMVSKGTVSAEELRGQLGERLPGAFKLAAEAIGVTEAELGKMLEQGEILATDLLPALSQKLNTLYNDGKAVGGLEASWNILNNALDRMMVSADNASGGTKMLADMLIWATGKANAFAEALTVIDNWRQGKGFAYGERDGIADEWALRARLVDEYVVKMKDAQAYADANDLDNSAARRAEGEALIARINEIDAKVKTTRADVQAARAEADALANRNASSMGDDAIRLYREHQAAIDANGKAIDDLNGKYDKSIAKKAEYAKMEVLLAEKVKLGLMTTEEAKAKLDAFAASQDKATESSRSRAKALSAEAQVVADVEKKYGLMAGQLDAVWKLESGRGKTAGTSSERWVKDLAAGEGHMTKIVGQFQMAEGTAKGLGANMATFNGQADAAGKYLAEAAAKGKTLWEQFAYYHGGPNEKAWGEKTRAYADAAVKIVADATGQMQDLGQNTGKVITDSLNKANAAVQSLIQRYLPARAAAEEYAQAQQALALASDAAGLSQEEQAIILQGLQQDLENSKNKASETADAWAEVWKNAVKRIDDTFASLWKDLFSGTKSTLESMKSAILSWLAEVAHALLTKPLVVAITTAMTGGSTAAQAAGVAGQAASGVSGLSSFSSIGSMFSTAFSLGSTFLSGVYEGVMGMFSTNMFSTIGTAWGAAISGSSMGAAAGLGVMAAYALPVIIGAAAVLTKWQKDQEPRYGTLAAQTGGRSSGLEDSEWGSASGAYVKGSFGLNFGITDKGSKNMEATELTEVYQAMADVSNALAQFFGPDLSSFIEAELQKMSDFGDGLIHLTENEGDLGGALAALVKRIALAAGKSSEDIGIAFAAVVGDLGGTAEEVGKQIVEAMDNATILVNLSDNYQEQVGQMLGLTGEIRGDTQLLIGYVNAMKTSGETFGATLQRMVLNMASLDAALTLTGTKTDATGQDFIDLANSLADAADAAKVGVQGLMQLQAAYYQNFFTEEERALKQKEDSLKAIDRWNEEQGLEGIDTSTELRAYIESLNLTTTAGQEAYVEAMKIVGAFISLDDALKKLGDTVPDLVDKFEAQRKAMRDLADQLDPTDPLSQSQRDAALAALQKAGYQGSLYDAKGIAAFLRALADLDDAGGEAGKELQKFIDTFTGVFDELARIAEERLGLQMRLFEMVGTDDQILALRRQQELAAADVSNREILRMIYLIEDLTKAETDRINKEYEAKVKAINAERTAAIAAYESRMASLSAERTAAQEMATLAEGTLSIIKSALSSLRAGLDFNAGSQAAAARQLAVWAQSGRLPESEPLQRVLDTLGRAGQQDYATQNEYRAAQGSTYANLLKLESVGTVQVDWAKRTVESLDRQITAAQAEHQAVLAAFDAQLQQAAAWRDEELAELRNLSFLTAEQRKALDDLLKSIMPAPDMGARGWDPGRDQLQPDPRAWDPLRDELQFSAHDAQATKPLPQQHLEELQALRTELATLRADMAAASTAQVIPIKEMATRLQKWDLDGLPESSASSGTALRVA